MELSQPRLGVVFDLPIDLYHRGPGISKSGLDDIDCTPALYAARRSPEAPPEPDRGVEGNLAHCAILEPDQFDARYAVGPQVSRATKAWKEFEATVPAGVIAIKPDQREAAFAQAKNLRSKPEVAEILSVGHAEVSAYWIDEITGELCRCRPDWVHPVGDDAVILFDVKTFSSAGRDEFRRQVPRMRYETQDAWYFDGFAKASGKRVLAFVFGVVETAWPHMAAALMLDEDARDQGRRNYRRNLNTYAECRATNVWPGYSDRIEVITLPPWAITED